MEEIAAVAREGKKSMPVKAPIEVHASDAGIDPAVYAGAMEKAGWARGKEVTRDDFDVAIALFMDAALGQ